MQVLCTAWYSIGFMDPGVFDCESWASGAFKKTNKQQQQKKTFLSRYHLSRSHPHSLLSSLVFLQLCVPAGLGPALRT